MTRQNLRFRMFLSVCAYVFGVAAVLLMAFTATIAFTAENASSVTQQASGGKIGPGYGRMQPINLGKPEKVVESTPYRSHSAKPAISRHKQQRPVVAARHTTVGPPMKIADVAQSTYRRPDVQRF